MRKYLNKLNKCCYGNCFNLNENYCNFDFELHSGNSELENFFEGGFKPGLIYELQGCQLTGKSRFLNKLLENNLHNFPTNKKIVFFDTNNSVDKKITDKWTSQKKEKRQNFNKQNSVNSNDNDLTDIYNSTGPLIHVKIYNFNELFQNLNFILNNKNKFLHSFIIIDSLSCILSKVAYEGKKTEDEDIEEFNNLIHVLAYQCFIGVIFTTLTLRSNEKEIYFFEVPGQSVKLKEVESGLSNHVKAAVDFTITFYVDNFSYKLSNLKNRNFCIRVSDEKLEIRDVHIKIEY